MQGLKHSICNIESVFQNGKIYVVLHSVIALNVIRNKDAIHMTEDIHLFQGVCPTLKLGVKIYLVYSNSKFEVIWTLISSFCFFLELNIILTPPVS